MRKNVVTLKHFITAICAFAFGSIVIWIASIYLKPDESVIFGFIPRIAALFFVFMCTVGLGAIYFMRFMVFKAEARKQGSGKIFYYAFVASGIPILWVFSILRFHSGKFYLFDSVPLIVVIYSAVMGCWIIVQNIIIKNRQRKSQ
jgi:hypothetical protein